MPSTQRKTTRPPQPQQRELDELAQLFRQGAVDAAMALASSLTGRFAANGFAWKVLGALLLQRAEFAESAEASRRAIALLPDDASSHNNLGAALLGLEQLEAAAVAFTDALAIAPGYAKAHFNLSKVLRGQGQLEEAQAHCRSALASDPAYAAAHFSLGNLLELKNRIPEAVASYRRALALDPSQAVMFSDMLHLMSHDVHTSAEDNLEMHRQFGQQFEPARRSHWGHYANTREAARCLKIGFVSTDAYDHALANYLEPLFRLLNKRPGLEVHLYYTHAKEDTVTARMRSYFQHWHDVAALDEAALEQRIRADAIDILVDVNGHTALNRLLTFARKPAPIQMSWLGYLGTTGLQAMDYYISDPTMIPPGQLDWQFLEKLAYLPSAVVFEPNASAPPVSALPALANGFISFGSFNRPNKINDAVIALWSLLLNQVPDAQLKLGGIAEADRAALIRRFAAQGVAAARLTFFDRTVQTDYLALHHQVDFCLDTFPFCGGATSAHAAWMGVPTLTLAGELPASRLGAAEMHHLGLDAFVADSIEDFIEKGLYWATHTAELAELRAGLRERFSQSPLGQTLAYANHFEAMLRTVWQRWCQGLPAESFVVEASAVAKTLPSATEPPDEALERLINLHARQEHAQVEALARQLTLDFPEHGAGWKYLGGALRQLGRVEEALDVQRHTTQRRPKDYEAHFNLAAELQQQGLFDEAVRSYLQALGLQPNNPMAYNNLSNIFKLMGLFPQAEQYCRQALALKPDMVIAQNNLGNALHAQGKYAEAETFYRQALEAKPNWAEAYNNLAICLKDQGYGSEAKEAYRKALSLKEDWAAARSNLLFSLSLDVQTPPDELHAEHLLFGQLFEPKLQAQRRPHGNDKNPERSLRIGFVSGDLYDHALTNFLEPLFAGLAARPELTLHAYYSHIFEDATTLRLRQHFHRWTKAVDLSEEALAEQIRADQIDILIDLSGHTAHNRLLTFARKPAPVQASYLGYLGSTGLQAMDYFLCDAFWVPPGQLDWQFTEKMAYLPSAVTFQASPYAAEVNALPALENGYITFGSFNRPNKLNPSVIALWSMLLQAVPTARMVLGGIAPERQAELFRRFMEHGVDINRLTFFPRANIQEYLAMHHQVDFCLDTFPYGGGATNANAAWMGVPTLCLAGETPASRFGPTEMHILGLDSFIADSIDSYIAQGVYWSEHVTELAELRATLRQRFTSTRMGQPQAFADDFAELLRAMWRRWCHDLPPDTMGLPAAAAPLAEPAGQPAFGATPEPPDLQTLLAEQRFDEALPWLQQAMAAAPADPVAHNNLGVALLSLGRLEEAAQALRQALAIHPAYTKAMVNLATVLRLQGQSVEAEATSRQALATDLQDASAWIQLGNALEAQGKNSPAQACYYKADMAHEPRRAVAHSNVLYLMNHDVLVEPTDLIAEHMAFGEVFEAPLRSQWAAHSNSKDPQRKLKVGFVSGDFCGHALTHFLEPAFKALSTRPLLELHAYSTRVEEDEVTQRLRWYFAQWRQVAALDSEDLARQIRADGIDVLIDLSGHTARNRLLSFALKPAPVQVGWVGYLGSSGLQAMDYYLCDEHWLPQGAHEWQFSEQLAYLPSAVVYEPDAQAPPVNTLPALANGYITFGSFNRVSKVNDAVVALWSLLMQRLPTSRLLMGGINEGSRQALEDTFAAHGIAAERIRFVPRVDMAAYLEQHHQIDLCLDTFPHGGGATTAHAAWMGVPTLSLVGDAPASRFGASLLQQLGLSALVATGIDDFVETGVRLASDTEQLQAIRSDLRGRFVRSHLGQPQQFALHLEASLRSMWSAWCADQPAASLGIPAVGQANAQTATDRTRIHLVSATKLSEADFWQQSALGQSMQQHMAVDARLSLSVAFENRQGLPDIFNRAIAQAAGDEVLVFIHDDVWLDEPFLVDSIVAGLARFDVIGVAGNRRRMARQAAWPFADARFIWDEKSNLSGRVSHGKNAHGQVCSYGPSPAECLLLDGMFMAARSGTLQTSGVRFDSQFDFHFYDLDFCRTASEAHLHLGTWPVALTHQSVGAYGSPGWADKYQMYLDKWQDPEPERPASVIRQVCIGHKAFELPIPAHVPVIWLGTAQVETHGPHTVHALNSISPELDTWHSLLGGSAGTFAAYLMLKSKLIDWSPGDSISILQYRKFMACRPMGTEAKNYPGLYLVARADAAALDLDAIHAEVTTPYLLPQPLALGNLYAQYANCHRGTDLLRYTAIATELGVISEQETLAFFNSTHMIPGGIEFGIYPVPVFLEILEKVSAVAMAFLQQHRPVCLDAEQRRAVSFCNERLGSYLLTKRLEQDYQHAIPTNIFGYMHNVVDGQLYQASPAASGT